MVGSLRRRPSEPRSGEVKAARECGRTTQRLPQRPSEGRASGKTRTYRTFNAQLASGLNRSKLSQAVSRDLVKCPGLTPARTRLR